MLPTVLTTEKSNSGVFPGELEKLKRSVKNNPVRSLGHPTDGLVFYNFIGMAIIQTPPIDANATEVSGMGTGAI